MIQSLSYQRIWKVSFPIILGGIAQNLVNVTDTAFLSRVGLVELGAAGNAGILYFVMIMLGLGFTIGVQIIIARRNGENNLLQIGPVFQHALVFLIPLSLLMFFFLHFLSPYLLEALTSSTAILDAANKYISFRSFGISFAYINFLFIAFYTGITRTKILIQATFLQSIVNVVFDYLLIFGHAGFPQLGIEGAAIASVMAEVVVSIFFIFHTYKKVDHEQFGLFCKFNWKGELFFKSIKVGSPIMIQHVIAISTWLSFFMIIEQVSERALAISHIVRSIYMVLMIPLFGFSSACSSLVSNLIGEDKKDDVGTLVKRIIVLSLLSTLVLMPLSLFFPEKILGIYTNDLSIIKDGIPVLYVVTAAMAFFSIAFIAFSAVIGTGKTKHSLIIELISISLYLFFAYQMALVYKMELANVWYSEFVYFLAMGSLSLLYLKSGKWKESKL